jgi:tRNA-dihydrouridine synthase B
MRLRNLDLQGNVFLAPMAGITDPPFRRVVQHFGVSALWTEMISAKGMLTTRKACRTMELAGHHVPTVFQISGADPEAMAEAARRSEAEGAAAIDVNMGCPVKKVILKGAGAALMTNVPLAGRIVASIRKAVGIALTVKIRSGWDDAHQNAVEVARCVESEGADAVIVHPRTRSREHSGPPSLSVLQEVKAAVRVPVIGNGGITTVEDAQHMLSYTGCDGVMIGRGVLGRPWLPASILGALGVAAGRPVKGTPLMDVIRMHFQYQMEWLDYLTAVRCMRKHLAWYSRGLADSTAFRRTVFREDDPDRVMAMLEHWFAEAVVE